MGRLNWFKKGSFETIPIVELARVAVEHDAQVQLPAFQRDAVWDETRVELLWDSILRGFPIGSLLFSRPTEKMAVRSLQRTRSEEAPGIRQYRKSRSRVQYLLLDGQQRTAAIALGFERWKEGMSAKLWLDLSPSRALKDGRRFSFYLCTLLHPWGRGATIAKRDDAERALGSPLPPDESLIGKTRPLQAKLPVPVGEVLHMLESGRCCAEAVMDLIPEDARTASGALEAERMGDFGQLCDSLRKALGYRVPAALIEEIDDISDLGTAFHRINREGVSMSADDLFFSGLKLHWPKSHDLVWNIYRDPTAGRCLRPPKIVHVASRLAVATSEVRSDLPGLSLDEFRKLVDDSGSSASPFLQALQDLLKPTGAPPVSRLHHALRKAREAISYNPEKDRTTERPDVGLPIPLMAKLSWRVWHTLVAWIDWHRVYSEESRREMIRYALLDHFYVRRQSSGLITSAFRIARDVNHTTFPGQQIYQHYASPEHHYLETPLHTAPEYVRALSDANMNPVHSVLQNERDLVLWAQRAWIHRWWPDFDPTRFTRAEELPYDADHIIPWSFFDRRGRVNDRLPKVFHRYKWAVGNSAGNIRMWPARVNRADGDRNPNQKHLLGIDHTPVDRSAAIRQAPYSLRTVGEVRRASLIAEEDVPLWTRAANVIDRREAGNHDWDDPARMRALRKAVEKRRERMYKAFFQQNRFNRWLKDGESSKQA